MSASNREIVTLGGGCFWCLEAVYAQVIGVDSVVPGYCGGHVSNPSYSEVCNGDTGHAEVIRVTFNPETINYRQLLRIFFTIHDPTTINRQGNDVGSQYRSIVFFNSARQRDTTIAVIKEFEDESLWDAPIITEIRAEEAFFSAEDVHRNYFSRNPGQAYCQLVVAPKVAKFRKEFSALISMEA